MFKATTRRRALRAHFQSLCERVGDWLYTSEDRAAEQRGWTVTSGRGGLSRTYRDPRLDALRSARDDSDQGER
jgi:hypothetical protein